MLMNEHTNEPTNKAEVITSLKVRQRKKQTYGYAIMTVNNRQLTKEFLYKTSLHWGLSEESNYVPWAIH